MQSSWTCLYLLHHKLDLVHGGDLDNVQILGPGSDPVFAGDLDNVQILDLGSDPVLAGGLDNVADVLNLV